MKPHILTGPRRRHCRCRVCRGRQVKAKHPNDYTRRIRCKHCGQFNTLVVDKWADNRGWRKYTCYCDGYHFPHRIRSEFCFENPNYGEQEERRLMAYGVMA